ncbi:CHEW-like protein [Sulfurimonas gotlandica GD1]|uniref:CHEW-like protein n=1 Tax=Sulfurimonas gotlandica (strain DSM 19862 / JCM 16533 / GD1) TaxID=929558 RepID=H1FXC6_SULGG|nr:chemotaxis protein CheW [Sulfurimonas gotlandica]EHP30622.1 CHEW-like protein [Sulfurimonas gotlandica GD1]
MIKDTPKKKHTMANKYLTFFVEDELYGLSISKIKEIIAPIHITNIPKTPKFIKGIINLRGSIIPVIDIRLKFGMDEKESDVNTAIIIYEVDGISIGFIVDQVEDVILLDDDHIVDTPNFGNNIDTSFIEKVAEIDENVVVMLLDLQKIFEASELLDIKTIKLNEKQTKKVKS